jgi:hypothetical protein
MIFITLIKQYVCDFEIDWDNNIQHVWKNEPQRREGAKENEKGFCLIQGPISKKSLHVSASAV